MDPVETGDNLSNRIAYKRWKLELAHNNSFNLKMKYEKTQLFGVLLGQMSEYSKDLIKECEVGRESFTEKCPLKLLNSIVLTHLANSRLGAEESLYSCNDHYSKLKMESNDTISSYYQKLQSAVSAKNEALLRCSPGVEFIKYPTQKYEYFKSDDLIEYPLTLEDAYSQLTTFHANNMEAQSHFSGHDMFVANSRGGHGGRGRSNNRNNNNSNERSEVKPIFMNINPTTADILL